MKKIIFGILMAFTALVVAVAPVYAEDKCVVTSILGNSTCDQNGKFLHEGEPNKENDGEYSCSCDDGEGSSIKHTLAVVIDILSIGIGIFGVLGITIVGVQYLTAGGNEEKTRKAKRRLVEIIIGIAVYAVMYSLLRWLLPRYEGYNDPGSILFTIKYLILP